MKKIFLIFLGVVSREQSIQCFELTALKLAYPNHIQDVTPNALVWKDGEIMPLNREKSLYVQMPFCRYAPGKHFINPSQDNNLCATYPSLFYKMYGKTPEEVQQNLVTVDWMPRIFGKNTHTLKVTRINDIDKKVINISNELEELVAIKPAFKKFLENPGGGFMWRLVANSDRRSNHSFGIAIDINTRYSNYWLWDLKKYNISEPYSIIPPYRNTIPQEIVRIFEKHGFIWGGSWLRYDTMHFEYRPEMLLS